MSNVLISSVGRRVALVELFARALKARASDGVVHGADVSSLSSAGQHAHALHRVPHVDDPTFPEALLEVCLNHNIGLVVPTIDPELEVLAEQADVFRAHGVQILISSQETVAISSDKRRTHAWLREHKFPTVTQWELDDIPSDAYPVIVKPVRGSASQGVFQADGPHQLPEDRAANVAQSIAPGFEFSIDVWVDASGTARCAVPRRRIEVRAGEVSKGVTERRPDAARLAVEIGESLPGAVGPLTLQIFRSVDEELNVIEINPRFGGGYPLSEAAGASYIRWALQWASDEALTPPSWDWREGLVMLRYDAAVFVDSSDLQW